MKKDKEKEKEKGKNNFGQIKGNFVHCGSPVIEGDNLKKWIPSYIRLSEIKTIMHKDDKNCIIFTYKDVWYSCYMNSIDLIKAINKNLSTLKGFGNDEYKRTNTSRNNSGLNDL